MPPLEVTTIARVKARRGVEDAVDDALLTALVLAVSQDLETRIARRVKIDDYVDVIPGHGYAPWISLPATVLSSVASVRITEAPPDGSEDALASSVYRVHAEECQLWVDPSYLFPEEWHARIEWNGGMAASTADFVANFPELADAADVEVVNRLVSRKNPAGTTTKVGPSELTLDEGYKIHRVYREACSRWRFRSL